MQPSSPFVFVSCQVGAERFLKRELAAGYPQLAFAFSRPGFVTFKCDPGQTVDLAQPLKSVFARTAGNSLGAVDPGEDGIQNLLSQVPDLPFRHLHVWQRDEAIPGENHFEPVARPESGEMGDRIRQAAPAEHALSQVAINRTARQGDYVFDVIIVDPQRWCFGWHQASAVPSRWPGGVPPIVPPQDMISRAYLKLLEAIRWSQFPIAEGDHCVELGSSPGGACQALLERGCHVMGVDPALMDARLLEHPHFVHRRARAADLKRKEFAETRWLMADANIAPQNTLDAVEGIVTHRSVRVRGLLLTLKLLHDEMVDELPAYCDRVRQWGYKFVRVRQLAFNRREVCLAAVPSKHHLRRRWRRS